MYHLSKCNKRLFNINSDCISNVICIWQPCITNEMLVIVYFLIKLRLEPRGIASAGKLYWQTLTLYSPLVITRSFISQMFRYLEVFIDFQNNLMFQIQIWILYISKGKSFKSNYLWKFTLFHGRISKKRSKMHIDFLFIFPSAR